MDLGLINKKLNFIKLQNDFIVYQNFAIMAYDAKNTERIKYYADTLDAARKEVEEFDLSIFDDAESEGKNRCHHV